MGEEPKREYTDVYVVGAGLSVSCGIPPVKYLFKELMDHIEAKNLDIKDEIDKDLEFLYPFFNTKYRNYQCINIEDVMTMIDIIIQFLEVSRKGYFHPARAMRFKKVILSNLHDLIVEKTKLARKRKKLKHINHFCNVLKYGDIVISFNWDMLIEICLNEQKKSYTYNPEVANSEPSILILKPHGSVNWFETKAPDVNSVGCEYIGEGIGFYRSLTKCSKISEPYITPPTLFKQFEKSEIQDIWREVFISLYCSRSISIIGYSFPKEDLYSRYVFRRAIRYNLVDSSRQGEDLTIKVINPDLEVKNVFMQYISDEKIDFIPVRFEGHRIGGTNG